MSESFERQKLIVPHGARKVLLHSCCAPCSGEIMMALRASEIEFTVFFYNPNIHPRREYEIRKNENQKLAQKYAIPFVDGDYDVQNWLERARGLEYEPERGKRCTMCFDLRLMRAALYAHENGFPVFATSLAISRWKNLAQVNDCGQRAAAAYSDVTYWAFNWRKGGGTERMIAFNKREGFYQQEYCGCLYSLRDSNAWRLAHGREKIKIGGLSDASEET